MLNIIAQLSLIFLLDPVGSSPSEKIIIDSDAGSDDALGILMLLRSELINQQYEVIAITCTYGNTEEENVEVNVLKTLLIAERPNIPVYAGAKKPLIGNFSSDTWFGEDGFGDAAFDRDIIAQVDRSMHAAVALVELTKQHQGDVTIVMLGPTTNVALAISLDPEFTNRVKQFYVMGSCVAGNGLYKPNVEFNFGADPEGNFMLLNRTSSSQLTLFPWEAAVNTKIPKDWRVNVLGKYDGPIIDFINIIERIGLENSENYYTFADAMTVAALLHPDIITSSLESNIEAVFTGAARGSVLVDYNNINKEKSKNAKIIQSIDAEKFKDALIFYLTCESIKC